MRNFYYGNPQFGYIWKGIHRTELTNINIGQQQPSDTYFKLQKKILAKIKNWELSLLYLL